MPLKDLSNSPMFLGWTTCHSTWAIEIMRRLNDAILSPDYLAGPTVRLGAQAEVDVGTFESSKPRSLFDSVNGHGDGTAVATAPAYAPPVPGLSEVVSLAAEDVFEVKVHKGKGGWNLVAAIELVSEANKDRDESRKDFAIKCASYLQLGVSVVVVDVIAERLANLHHELCVLLELPLSLRWKSPTGLSAVCYRTTQGRAKGGGGNGQVRLDVWPFALAVGEELPTVPLWLAADLAVPLELELTYAAACKSLRLA